MRGKASSRVRSGTFLRITPAYAGKSGINCNQIPVTGDHPRLCGEKDTQVTGKPSNRGSPPPMRGKVTGLDSVLACFGITPAYAGKRFSDFSGESLDRDHPRLCGEKLGRKNKSDRMFGITPAYAGKRATPSFLPCLSRDHPRLCGEKFPFP